MKRMVDNAQTLNQVAKYTDVVEDNENATLQWEGNIEINGNVHTKPKEIVELKVNKEPLNLTPDTSKRYHIIEGQRDPSGVEINLTIPDYKITWDTTMSDYGDENGGANSWVQSCSDGWGNEGSYLEMLFTVHLNVDLYIWFDEVNQVAYISAFNDI